MKGNMITLYPSNWLYNASVMGFLYSLEKIEGVNVEQTILANSGEANIQRPLFSNLKINERYFGDNKIASIVGKSTLYRNYLQANQKDFFHEFVKALDSIVQTNQCDICGAGWSLNNDGIARLNKLDPGRAKFLDRISNLSMVHNSLLGPSVNEFPNAFWSLRHSPAVCHLCSYLLIHHHLSFTDVSDHSEVFINVPSFRVMYKINKLVKEFSGHGSREKIQQKRQILAMSIIEYAMKIKGTFGFWTGMNLQMISKKTMYNPDTRRSKTEIEFFSLPYEVIHLISDSNIASLLSEIGEFKILNLVLNQQYRRLMEVGYRLLRIAVKDDRSKQDQAFISEWLYFDRNKRTQIQLQKSAESLLRLYALIEQKQTRSARHGITSISS